MDNMTKYHWYDGIFYDKLIAPNQTKMFLQIKELIKPGLNVLDVGCGTGYLEFLLADKCKSIIGIDLSERNIERANKKLQNNPISNITFLHTNVEYLKNHIDIKFDYTILTYVIHEISEKERFELLQNIRDISENIIIGDYFVPQPMGFWKILNEIVEFAAGKEHYRNFKSFLENGGIKPLAQKVGLQIINEIRDEQFKNYIVVFKNRNKI